MHPYRIISALMLAALSSATWAHGSHAAVAGDGLLHLLAHHWPLLAAVPVALLALSLRARLRG